MLGCGVPNLHGIEDKCVECALRVFPSSTTLLHPDHLHSLIATLLSAHLRHPCTTGLPDSPLARRSFSSKSTSIPTDQRGVPRLAHQKLLLDPPGKPAMPSGHCETPECLLFPTVRKELVEVLQSSETSMLIKCGIEQATSNCMIPVLGNTTDK